MHYRKPETVFENVRSVSPDTCTLVGCQKPGHLAARLRCAETKVATWDDLAFKLIILGWNVRILKKRTIIKTKSDKTEHGIGKSARLQDIAVHPYSSQQPPGLSEVGNPLKVQMSKIMLYGDKEITGIRFTICHENGIYQDLLNTYESSDDDSNVVNAPREPVVIPICYNDDDDEYSFATQEHLKKFSSAITPDLPKSDSLIMEDEHLDTILETESDELIKSSVENLVHTPSESDGISEGKCDLPVYDDFTPKKDKVLDDIISIPLGNGNDYFNVASSLIESVLNRDNVISSLKIDFLIEEFAGELALIAPNPPGIVEADLDPKEDIRFIENLMYDNSFSRPLETLKDDYEIVIDSNNDYFSSDDDSYENIDYVDASPPDSEVAGLEVEEK
ncbi:hypothetical protein Tco_0571351 [Tanacetum coccineum]